MAYAWDALPREVRDAVERHIGPVTDASPVTGGQNNDITAVLSTLTGRVFVKGVRGISRPMRFLRNEVAAGPLVTGLAPTVLFSVDLAGGEGDGWFVAGFEHRSGRPIDLTPRSADLPLVAAMLARIADRPAGALRGLGARWTVRDWWARAAAVAPHVVAGWDIGAMDRLSAAAPQAVAGDRLCHTDLHRDQFIVGDNSVHVIDWGWPAAAAPWVDTGYMVIRLIEAGHAPSAAETWACALPCWADVSADEVTAFGVYVAGLWTVRAAEEPGAGAHRRAAAARAYAAWRVAGRAA